MFGMGTGGSLRLLSPETRGASAFCCRLSRSVGSAKQRPPDFPFLCVASGLSAPSKPHRLKIWFPLTKILPPLYSKLLCFLTNHWPLDQALDRLVSSSSIRYRTFTDDLSTLSSSRGLTCLKQWQFYSPGGLHAYMPSAFIPSALRFPAVPLA